MVGMSNLWPLYLRLLGSSTTKNYRPVRRPTIHSNLNHRVVEHHKEFGLFSDFHHGFRPFQSTLDLPTAASDIIASAFDRSVTWYVTVARDISKGFYSYRVWHTGLFQKLIFYGISGWSFVFIFSVLCNNRLWLNLDLESL